MEGDYTNSGGFSEVELALTSAAMAGDSGTLYRLASELMATGVPFDVLLFDYLMSIERSTGARWQQGDYLVAEEHAVTASIETVISLLAGMLDQPQSGPLIVVATAEGDDHSLPARAVAAHLLFMGHRTLFLGANVPPGGLKEFLEGERPLALVLSAAISIHLLGARAVIQAAHEVGVPVVVGGKAFGSDGRWAPAVGADAWVDSLSKVHDVVEGWAEGAPPVNEASPIPEPLRHLLAARASIAAAAEAELAKDADGSADQRTKDEIRLLLAAVESGLLTGDQGLVAEMLQWQESILQTHGFDASSVARAAQTALHAASPEGAALLAGARTSL